MSIFVVFFSPYFDFNNVDSIFYSEQFIFLNSVAKFRSKKRNKKRKDKKNKKEFDLMSLYFGPNVCPG